jgi:outer membrane protein, adhesin transport system
MFSSCRLFYKRRKFICFEVFVSCFVVAGCAYQAQDVTLMQNALTEVLQRDAGEGVQTLDPVLLQDGLRVALVQAVAANPAYVAALAVEQESSANIDIANSARLPLLGLNGNLGGVREGGSRTNVETGLATNLSVSQLIYDGGASAATVNQAIAQALAAQAERRVRGNEIALEASRAWTDVWQFGQRIDLLRSRTSEMDVLAAQIERMASTGMLDRTSLDSAQRKIVEISLEDVRLQSDLQEAQLRFQRYFGKSVERVGRPDELVTLQQALFFAQQWREAPSLQRAGSELLISRSAVSIAEAGFQPRANIAAGIRSPLEKGEPVSSSLGLTLEYTLGDGGRRQATLRGAEARLEAAEAQFAEAQLSLKAELDAAVTRLQAIEQSMILMEESVRLSVSEVVTVRSQITTGQSNLLQLVEAEIALYRAQDQQIVIQAEKLTLHLVIASLTGALSELLDLEPGE